MAGSLNKVTLIGNLGADPDIRSTQGGEEIARLSIATSERWKDRNTNEQREQTEWHRVVVFSRGLVPVVKNYLRKGSKVYIEGQLQTRKWQDKQGRDTYTTEIVLRGFGSALIMLDGRGGEPRDDAMDSSSPPSRSSGRSKPSAPPAGDDDFDDEIPF